MQEQDKPEIVLNEDEQKEEKKSKEVWNKFKRGLKSFGDSTKKAVNKASLKSKIFFAFSDATTDFELVGCLDFFKKNKTTTGVLDEVNSIVYFKAVDDFESDLKVGTTLLHVDSKQEYEIEAIDFNNKVDYYVTVDGRLEPVCCYKAIIKKKN